MNSSNLIRIECTFDPATEDIYEIRTARIEADSVTGISRDAGSIEQGDPQRVSAFVLELGKAFKVLVHQYLALSSS